MSKKNNPPKERDKKTTVEWWERYSYLLYAPSLVMSIIALIISIVRLLR